MEWYSQLPPQLVKRAYRAKNGELAWCRSDAIEVLTVLKKAGQKIVGVDIWLPTTPGPTIPTPFVYDWSSELDTSFASGHAAAEDFVRRFEWDKSDAACGKEPYFNISSEIIG